MRPGHAFLIAVLLAVTAGLTVSSLRVAVAEDTEANLQLSVRGPAVAAPGGGATFTATVTNTGQKPAQRAALECTLPQPLQFVAASGGGTFAAPDKVTWSLGTLAHGDGHEATLYASVPLTTAVGHVVTSCRAATDSAESNYGDNQSDAGTDILPADLRVEIASAALEARPGEALTYTVTVANVSAAAAEGVLVVANLAPGTAWAWDDATSPTAGFSRTVQSDSVRWLRPVMAGPSSVQWHLVVRVASDLAPGTSIVSSVAVAALTRDSVPENNAATSSPLTVRWPDVWIAKSGPREVAAGREAEYTLRLGNHGPGGAPAVAVTDTLPAGLLHSRSAPSATERADGTLSWHLGEIGAGDERILRVWAVLSITAAPGTTLTNSAVIGSGAADLDGANNDAAAMATVVAGEPYAATIDGPSSLQVGGRSADVAVRVLDAGGHPVQDGTAVLFQTTLGHFAASSRITSAGLVTNTLTSGNGTGLAHLSVRAGSVLGEAAVAFTAGPVASLQLSVQPETADVGQVVTVTVTASDAYGNLAADGTSVAFETDHGSVNPTSGAMLGGHLSAVWISSRSGVGRLTARADGQSAQATATFRPGTAAAILLEASRESVGVGDGTATVIARVRDRYGNPVADGAMVQFVAEGGSVAPTRGATVAGSAGTTFRAGTAPGIGSVSAATGAVQARVTIRIQPADLTVAGTMVGPRGRTRDTRTYPGEVISYTVSVRNEGLATARGVYLSSGLPEAWLIDRVDLPDGVQETDDPPAGLAPDLGEGYVDRAWALPDLRSGQAVTLTIGGRLTTGGAWSAFQTLFARSVVTTTTAENTTGDLVHMEQLGIYAADHSIEIALDYGASVVEPGGSLVYDIAFGNSSAGADGVVIITDTLPAHTSFQNWTSKVGSEGLVRERRGFAPASRQLVWEIDGEDVTNRQLRLWLSVDEDAPSQSILQNTIEIGATVFDYDLGDNSATDAVWLNGINLAASIEGPSRAAPGQAVTYRLMVMNKAQRDGATNVAVVAVPPAGTRLMTTEPPALIGGGTARWSKEVLAAGGLAVFDMVVEVPASYRVGTSMRYQADVAADQTDSYPPDNRATVETLIVPDQPSAVTVRIPSRGLTACTSDEVEIAADVRDRFGNAVADGTMVRWTARGGQLGSATSQTQDGVASVLLSAGRKAGTAEVTAEAGSGSDSKQIQVVPGSPRGLAVTVDPQVVPRFGRSRVRVNVLDGCGNTVADGWPISLRAERGTFEGASGQVTVPTVGGSVRAGLRVGGQPGPLRVTAVSGMELGQAVVTVTEKRQGLYLPCVVQ